MKHVVLPVLLLVTAFSFVGCVTPAQLSTATPAPTLIPTLPAPTQPAPVPTQPPPTLPPIPEPTKPLIPSPTRPSLPNITPQVPPPIDTAPTALPGGGPVITDPTLLKFVNDAKIDLSQRANVLPDEIKVISAEKVEWSDGSLGCPKPGVMYTQATVPGYLIVLQAADKEWNYHAGRDRVFWCDK